MLVTDSDATGPDVAAIVAAVHCSTVYSGISTAHHILVSNSYLKKRMFGRIRCLLLVELYFIPLTHDRYTGKTLVLGLHTLPIIFMGLIHGNIGYMYFLFI